MKTKLLPVILCVLLIIMLSACNPVTQSNVTDTQDEVEEVLTTPATQPTITTTPLEENIETEPIIPEPENFEINLSFAGDFTLTNVTDAKTDSGFLSFAEKNDPSYFLEKVKNFFESDDFTVINLECVLSDRNLPKRDKGNGVAFWFKGPTKNAQILSCGGIDAVSLANNHTFDYKDDGYQDTKAALDAVGVQHGYKEDIIYFEKNGFKIAVICHGMWYEEEANEIIKLIKTAEEQSNYQIVFYHGGTEKKHAPEQWRINASRKLVDSGADLVLGNHPHVLQPIETYNGAKIVYSLGNFCYGGHLQPRNRTMIYQMRLVVDCDTLELKDSIQIVIPCYVYTDKYNNYQPAPIAKPEEIQKVIQFLNQEIELPY